MPTFPTWATAVSALLTTGSDPVEADSVNPPRVRWSSPSVFYAEPGIREAYASLGFQYGDYRGRKVELEEFLAGATLSPNFSVWYSHQDVLIKGRARTSRFRNESDSLGLRWLLQTAGVRPYGLAVEFIAVRPTEGVARTATSKATYPAPTINTLKLIASTRKRLDGQIAFTRLEGPDDRSGNAFDVGVGKDLVVSERWTLRLQGHAIAQNIDRPEGDVDFEIKPVAYAALAYRLGPSAHLELDLTFMPSGTPLAFGGATALTGYQLYRVGGPAEGLRRDAFGMGAIRIVARTSF